MQLPAPGAASKEGWETPTPDLYEEKPVRGALTLENHENPHLPTMLSHKVFKVSMHTMVLFHVCLFYFILAVKLPEVQAQAKNMYVLV